MRLPVLAVAGLAALLTSCVGQGTLAGITPTPGPPSALDVRLLGEGGPYSVGPPNIVAATSEPKLDALLQPVAAFFHQAPDPWDANAAVGGRVYLGLPARYCKQIDAISARLTAPSVVAVNVSMSGQCAPGAGAAATPAMYLAAIPSKQLPPTVITFRLSGGAGQARVDLRPNQLAADAPVIATQARAAVKAARLQSSMAPIAELDLIQFPTVQPACKGVPATNGPQMGFFVVVSNEQGDLATSQAFVYLNDRLWEC